MDNIENIIAKIIPPLATSEARNSDFYGALGSYVSGVWGTILTLITIFGLFITINQARKSNYQAKIYQIFMEMMKTHEDIISSMAIEDKTGRSSFDFFLSKFRIYYKITRDVENDDAVWSIENRIDIAFSCVLYSPYILLSGKLDKYGKDQITAIFKKMQLTEEGRPKEQNFIGIETRLSHYFRYLYSIFKFIESTNLKENEKRELGKIMRSRLSDQEQLALTLNIISLAGAEWERSGLIEKYKPIKNIPMHFLNFDSGFNIKDRFPYIDFEWEATSGSVVKTSRISLGRFTLIIINRLPKVLPSS